MAQCAGGQLERHGGGGGGGGSASVRFTTLDRSPTPSVIVTPHLAARGIVFHCCPRTTCCPIINAALAHIFILILTSTILTLRLPSTQTRPLPPPRSLYPTQPRTARPP